MKRHKQGPNALPHSNHIALNNLKFSFLLKSIIIYLHHLYINISAKDVTFWAYVATVHEILSFDHH